MTFAELKEWLADADGETLARSVVVLADGVFHDVEIAVSPTNVVFIPVMGEGDGE